MHGNGHSPAGDRRSHDVIETARLRLEPWNDAHFERFAQFMRDPAVIRYIRAEPLDRDRALEQHEHSLAEWDIHGFGKRAIIEAETDPWLGFVELSLVGPGKGSRDDDVEIGYFVEPSRWGEGIATEAAFATRDEAFDRCGINELIGRCRVENVASARVLAKVGLPAPAPLRARRRHRRRDPPAAARRLDRRRQRPRRRRRTTAARAPERSTVKRDSARRRRRPGRRRARRSTTSCCSPGARGASRLRARSRPRAGVDDRGRRRAVDGRRRPRHRRRPVAAHLHLRRLDASPPARAVDAPVASRSVTWAPDAVPSPLRIERG